MANKNRTARKSQPRPLVEPQASRPDIEGYGIPKSNKDLLPWSHVEERMAAARVYWISTVSPDQRPHATPVDGLWLDGQLYFGGSPQTRRNRNLGENPAVCVHLESGSDVVILHGDARELVNPERDLTLRLVEASGQKYGYAPKPEDYSAGGVYAFRPQVVFAWKQFPNDVTRWVLPTGE
jgi:nitroimidazol reductase NimA-like FMN-containing flavoprotein (pyridoxamine 5'-phosphate oxidase superfamily)